MRYAEMQKMLVGLSIFVTLTIQTAMQFIELEFWLYKVLITFISGIVSFTLIYNVVKGIYFAVWRKRNKQLYIQGEWFHVHLCSENISYLRFGTIQVRQKIEKVHFTGSNYDIDYDKEKNIIDFDYDGKKTNWNGDYELDSDKGILLGMYSSTRAFNNKSHRETKGIHQFMLKVAAKGVPNKFEGTFNNIEKSTTQRGMIYVFKNKQDAESFILDKCKKQLEKFEKNKDYANELQ